MRDTVKKILLAISGVVLTLNLAACGAGNDETPTTSSSASTTVSTSSSTSSTEPSSVEPSPEETTPVAGGEEPVMMDPFIIECMVGTPGPSLMSDGSIQFTDYCWEVMGGPAYLEEESQSGYSAPAQTADSIWNAPGDGYQCPGTDAWVDDSSFCTPENLGSENVAFADGGTCAGYKCGYGHNSDGDRNPTSGEIQTLHGCQDGYITDPELCGAVAWVETHQY